MMGIDIPNSALAPSVSLCSSFSLQLALVFFVVWLVGFFLIALFLA